MARSAVSSSISSVVSGGVLNEVSLDDDVMLPQMESAEREMGSEDRDVVEQNENDELDESEDGYRKDKE